LKRGGGPIIAIWIEPGGAVSALVVSPVTEDVGEGVTEGGRSVAETLGDAELACDPAQPARRTDIEMTTAIADWPTLERTLLRCISDLRWQAGDQLVDHALERLERFH
jgi:hypothetical protein